MKQYDLPVLTDAQAAAALDTAVEQVRVNLPLYTFRCQNHSSVDNIYPACDNDQWTCGFWPGEVWLSYERTGDEAFKKTAMTLVASFDHRIRHKIEVDHHDMGFLYSPSCVAAYKLTGDAAARDAAILAADQLISRFQPKGQFIQAWGEMGAPENYRYIIDCLLNLPLLYWASEVTGDPHYRDIAVAHTRTSVQNLVRPDHSTYHTFFFDPGTGAPLRGATRQGYRDGSAWARGQAWGVYGMALSYRYTGDEACIRLFRQVTDYFLEHLPADGVPYWDLEFTSGDEPRDSSASAIAACGMLEMAPHLPAEEAARYTAEARRLAAALVDTCAVTDPAVSNGLLLHGVYARCSPYNPIPRDRGVDECNTWGDYFYMELLTRLTSDWHPYW